MAKKYETKLKKARFVVSPFSPEVMASMGSSIIAEIFGRWDRFMDVNDGVVPAGKKIQDLNMTGRLRRSIKALSANENKVTLGPTDGIHTSYKRTGRAITRDQRGRPVGNLSFSDLLTILQRRWRMWGISPSERTKLVKMMIARRPVKATNG